MELDGSGRLITRNRRFVKKIESQPDVPQDDLLQAKTILLGDHDDNIPNMSGDIVLGQGLEDEVLENYMTGNQFTHENLGETDNCTNDVMNDGTGIDDMIYRKTQL